MPLLEEDGGDFSLVGQIKVEGDQVINLSKSMERSIRMIAVELKRNDPTLAKTHTDDEWRQTVRSCLAFALAKINTGSDPDEHAKGALVTLRKSLKEYTYGPREFVFGCTLFEAPNIPGFDIGPVRFEPRSEWLTRKEQDGAIKKITARRVRQTWSGHKSRKRKGSVDALFEHSILSTVGENPYVCSVKTTGLAPEAGRLKALTAARLAMTAIALRWEIPSDPLRGFNLTMDGAPRSQKTLAFVPNVMFTTSETSHVMPYGAAISAAEWTTELSTHRLLFDSVGEAIDYFINATGNVARPNLMNTLSQALLWFHEGCREHVTLMAVVKFSASLEALAMGKESEGILKLIAARLGMARDQLIRKDGPTLQAAIDKIYKDGRSQTIHGNSRWIGHDWSSTRMVSEILSRLCLISALTWAARNQMSDDPSLLREVGR